MKKFKSLMVLIVVILVASGGVWATRTFLLAPHAAHEHTKGEIYYCPMHPTYTSDRVGECPICGMALVKSQTDEMAEGLKRQEQSKVEGYSTVALSAEKQQMIGIRLATVKTAPAIKVIRTVGRIAYDPELYQAQEEYLQGLRAFSKAKASGDAEIQERAAQLVDSSKIKLELMGLNDHLIEMIEQSGQPDKSLLLSKAGGTVWMYAPIYEYDLDAVEVGQNVRVEAGGIIPGKSYEGTIRAIDPVLDSKTRSLNIRAVLENPDGLLKPNVYVNAEIEIDLGSHLLIPETAVLDSGERQIAFVMQEEGIFVPTLVKLGQKVGKHYIVLSGVTEGDQIVDQATFFVDSESKLRSAIGSAGEHQH